MRAVLIGLLALLVSAPAMGEPIPRETLQSLFNSCVAQRPNDARHRNYCVCVSNHTRDKISLQLAYTVDGTVQERLKRGIPADQTLRDFPEVWNIGQECRVTVGMERLP